MQNNIRIESFSDVYDAILFLETELEYERYTKGEILKTPDGRWRVALVDMDGTQLELFDGT
jgi:hypothetical protein